MIREGVDVISMSFGQAVYDGAICNNITNGVNLAIQNAVSNGIILVASAGNDGPLYQIGVLNNSGTTFRGILSHPACVKDVIAVGATYKTNYSSYEFGDDVTAATYFSSKIHVIIEVNDVKEKEYEWEAFNFQSEKDFFKTGFDISIKPSSWPAKVKIKFEGMDRIIAYHRFFGNRILHEYWWPGNESKGDGFWEDQYTFNQGKDIVIQFSAWPETETTEGQDGWIDYHAYFYRPAIDEPIGIKYHNIFYYVYNRSDGLKDIVPFWSDRAFLTEKTYPDVVAPGHLICAANSSQTEMSLDDVCRNTNYVGVSGTSFSAPHVGGLVALLKEANPFASYDEIKRATIETADLIYSDFSKPPFYFPWNSMGNGRINVTKAVKNILKWGEVQSGAYADNIENPKKCSNFNNLYTSANQIRNYFKQCPYPNYDCEVTYDSFISKVCVNGNCGSDVTQGQTYVTSDVFVQKNSNIEVEVEINNTGKTPQRNWFVGVEFWNVSNFSNPLGSRDSKGKVITLFNNKDKTQINCSIASESNPDLNHQLDPGETIKIKCWVPASFYPISQREFTSWCDTCGTLDGIMLWVHERDLDQDAGNNGNAGNDWWTDALAKSFRPGIDDPVNGGPAKVKVAIVLPFDSDGKNYFTKGNCTYYSSGTPRTTWDECACLGSGENLLYCNNRYRNAVDCGADPKCWWGLIEQWPGGSACQSCFKNCNDLGNNYMCSDGKCIFCRLDAEDSDGTNFFTKGTCIDYFKNSSGCQKKIFNDFCGCVPKCNFGEQGCDPLIYVECSNRSSSIQYCEADSNCTWGAIEYFVSGPGCSGVWKNCKAFGTGYSCSDGVCINNCKCGSWVMTSTDSNSDCRYGDCIECTTTWWSRTCNPTSCDLQTRRSRACR
jgi:hypothetical protein